MTHVAYQIWQRPDGSHYVRLYGRGNTPQEAIEAAMGGGTYKGNRSQLRVDSEEAVMALGLEIEGARPLGARKRSITVRLDADLLARLRAAAMADRRSLPNMLEMAIEHYLRCERRAR